MRKKHILIIGFTLISWLFFLGAYENRSLYTLQQGLKGVYYNNPGWQGTPAFSEVETSLNLHAARKRILTFPQKNYSAQWTGWLNVEKSGEYVFKIQADDGAFLDIDGHPVVDTSGINVFQPVSQRLLLTTGLHNISLKYVQYLGTMALRVFWQEPDEEEESLPSQVLFPERPTDRQLRSEHYLQIALQGGLWLLLVWSMWIGFYFRKQIYIYLPRLKNLIQKIDGKILTSLLYSRRFRYFCLWGGGLIFIGWIFSQTAIHNGGLRLSYYDNPTWQGEPLFSEVVSSLSLRVVDRHGFSQRYYSLQWNGWLSVPHTGDYALVVKVNDQARIQIDDVPIVRYKSTSGKDEASYPLHLTKGFHALTLQYAQEKYDYVLCVDWILPGGKREAFPLRWCFPEKPKNSHVLWERNFLTGLHILGWGEIVCLGIFLSVHQQLLVTRLLQRFKKKGLKKLQDPLTQIFRSSAFHLSLLFVVGSLIIFHHLGEQSLGERIAGTWSIDEVTHTLVAQHILETGNWCSFEYRGEPYYNKPPLKFWLSALTFYLGGDSEFCIRVWSALFGLLAILMTYLFGKHLTHRSWIGLLGALILLSSPYYIFLHNIREGVPDSLSNTLIILALLFFWLRTKSPSFYYLAGVCVGLGTLTKSINGLIPFVIIGVYLGITRTFREFRNPRFYVMILLGVFLPSLWYVPQSLFLPGFFDEAIKQQVFARSFGTLSGKFFGSRHHLFGLSFYPMSLLKGMSPWGPFYPLAILMSLWVAGWKRKKEHVFLLIWIFVVLGGFSLSKYKSHWYSYPSYPAIALLIACFVYKLMTLTWRRKKTYPLFALGVSGVFIVLLSYSLYANYARTSENPKVPIHRLVEYLQHLEKTPYKLVTYHLQEHHGMERPYYYLEKVKLHLHDSPTIEDVKSLVQSGTPVFVIVNPETYDSEPFFQEAPYRYIMLNKTGDPTLDKGNQAKWRVLVYNYHPDSTLVLEKL